MTGPFPGAVDAGGLVKDRKFNSGGQGTVWAVRNRTINRSWPVAYKEYHAAIRRELQDDVLAAMVDFLPSLPAATGRWLAECTAWPAVLVTDSAGVSGFLMRQIPERFFRRLDFAPEEPRPAGFQYLLNPQGYLDRAGVALTPRQRVELLLDFTRTLGRLHSLGVVVGDLSANNLLFSLEGAPACFLIDCDAMGLRRRWALPPVETPNWSLPPGEQMGGPAGDVYKLGLLAARLFAGEQDGQDLAVLRAAAPAVGQLAERSLHGDPARRPAAEDWLGALTEAVATVPAALPPPGAPPGATAPVPPPPPAPHGVPSPQPSAPFNTPPTVPARLRPQTTRRRRPGRWIVAALLAVMAFAYGPDVYDSLREESGGRTDGPGVSAQGLGSGGGEATAGTDDGDTTAEDTEEAQAGSLNSLLERNTGNRSAVGDAVSRMTSCPGRSGLREAKSVFEDAASEREGLLRDLDALASDELPSSMTRSLEVGWRASADADDAYARLAGEMMSGCTRSGVTSSARWEEAADASERATRAKKAFVSDWNPIAESYGLTTLTWDEV